MWITILCIEYILWGIPTIESTFDVANVVKTDTVKEVPINTGALLNIQACLIYVCLGKWYLLPYLVVPLISARVPLISIRVSAHCQAILLGPMIPLFLNKMILRSRYHAERLEDGSTLLHFQHTWDWDDSERIVINPQLSQL